jgi:S-adenosylmethionine:tRNA-ribosyltransferase-isomerase (queuine synthetase)
MSANLVVIYKVLVSFHKPKPLLPSILSAYLQKKGLNDHYHQAVQRRSVSSLIQEHVLHFISSI